MGPARRRLAMAGLFVAAGILIPLLLWACMIRMPGQSYQGDLPALEGADAELRETLRRDVTRLAVERNVRRFEALREAARWIEGEFRAAGHEVNRIGYDVEGRTCENLEVEIAGGAAANEIVVVGAHYDSVVGCPGANDNATGTAAMLALARAFAGRRPARTLRFAAFVNEEPPHFQTARMGSWVYAKRCREREERIVAMLSLETMGFYRTEGGTQQYPWPLSLFYPSTGNFIGFVGNLSSASLVRTAVGSFRRHARFPSEGAALPGWFPGVGWSDHWAFWQEGFDAIMVTDTAPFRYPHYHTAEDTPDKVDFDRLARVVAGLSKVVEELTDR
jgi:hypothetical protein